MVKVKEPILYEVLWKDHYTNVGWHSLDSFQPSVYVCKTVGFVVHENDECMTIASTFAFQDQTVGDPITILKSCIVSKKKLLQDNKNNKEAKQQWKSKSTKQTEKMGTITSSDSP